MKSKQSWMGRQSKRVLTGIMSLAAIVGTTALAQAPAPQPGAKQETGNTAVPSSQATAEKAWAILREALKNENAEKRAKAVRALGLLTGNVEAEKAAVSALQDKKPTVRVAAATALGSMQAQHANLELEGVLQDSEPAVVLAVANSLLLLHDNVGYDIYYDVLTGERRAGKGLIKEQLSTFKDKKKLAELGFEQGIGFIPYAGGNGVRGVQNGEEGRFLAGTGGSGKTTGPRSKPRNRESAGKSNHGQELVSASGCAGGYLSAGRSLAGFRDCDGFG